MNESEDFDPEYIADLEARLYSQVFHSTEETHIENVLDSVEITDNSKTSNKQKYRYFVSKQTESRPTDFIPVRESNVPVFQQDVIICPESRTQNGCNNIIQNNITVHQYTLPILYRNPLHKSRNLVKDLQIDNVIKKKRRRTKKRKSKQAVARLLQQQQTQSVILLSDGSDDDCIIIPIDEVPKQSATVPEKQDNSDEDIVYIPAAPPEIISLDGDDTSEKVIQNVSPTESVNITSNKPMPESVASNDFLDSNSVDHASNFNFSLHGADFNAQSNEFVRPPNPVENCETESSCSTIDQSREFNNSVKTIVFDEIEFPRGDIFADKSLESFKTFITPQRKSESLSTPDTKPRSQTDKKKKKVSKASSTSDSSSESEYEDGANHKQFDKTEGNKSLPSLSLMLPEIKNCSTTKEKSETSKNLEKASEAGNKEQVLDDTVKMPSRTKKKRCKSTEVDVTKTVEDEEEKQVQLKKKRGLLDDAVEEDIVVESTSTPKISKKKKSKKSENEDSFMSQVIVIDDSEEVEGKSSAKKKKKRKSCSEKSDNVTKPNNLLDISGLKDMILIDDIEFDEQAVEIIEQDLTLANCVSKKPLHDNKDLNRLSHETFDFANFTLESIQSSQSDDPELWQISVSDRHNFFNTESKGPRCNRCRHFGHVAIHCTEKPGPPPCYLCGGGDHQEPRCPNKICTQCGTPGQYSTTYCGNCFKFRHTVCRLCQQKGHIEKTCPDLWRRYHLTTKRGPIVPSTGDQLKPRNQRWCSGCGSQGHLEHECLHYQRLYPPSLPYIVNYDDVLAQAKEADKSAPSLVIQPPEPQQPTVAIDPCFTNVLQNALSMELQNQGAIPQEGTGLPSLLDIPVQMPNPFALALQRSVMHTPGSMALNELTTASVSTKYTKMKIDVTYITNYFMTAPGRKIQSFLQKELVELDSSCNVNPKSMKSLLFRTERFYAVKKKTKYDKQRVAVGFRALNMFIFGHHQLRDGRLHVRFLRAFLNRKKCNPDIPQRKSLLSAYCYVFGPERHAMINYFGILRAIQQRYGNQEV